MKVRWTEPAATNWEKAFDYIAQENTAAALHIAESILDMTEMLGVHPWAGRLGRFAGTRELLVTKSPFILVYEVDSAEENVWILAIHHGRRRWPTSFPKK